MTYWQPVMSATHDVLDENKSSPVTISVGKHTALTSQDILYTVFNDFIENEIWLLDVTRYKPFSMTTENESWLLDITRYKPFSMTKENESWLLDVTLISFKFHRKRKLVA